MNTRNEIIANEKNYSIIILVPHTYIPSMFKQSSSKSSSLQNNNTFLSRVLLCRHTKSSSLFLSLSLSLSLSPSIRAATRHVGEACLPAQRNAHEVTRWRAAVTGGEGCVVRGAVAGLGGRRSRRPLASDRAISSVFCYYTSEQRQRRIREEPEPPAAATRPPLQSA